ncbi:MAG: hypothetical protein U0802_26205 [Candidatus Binatia bacterium]
MDEDDSRRRTMRHVSGPTHCPRRAVAAIVSAVERDQGDQHLRSILWCSLRGTEQWCAESCPTPRAAEPRST